MQLTISRIESLEARIAPASIFTYTDVDGDLVTVKSSLGTLDATNFTFNLAAPGPLDRVQLQKITLGAEFENSDITITVKAAPGGNGSVNVGAIIATDVDLKNVSIAGDLGRIEAGDAIKAGDTTLELGEGVASLTVDSLGRGGLALQGAGASLISFIDGALGRLTVKGDIHLASFFIEGNLGSVTLGGSLLGGADGVTGLIFAGANPAFASNIGTVKIGGSIVGGAGEDSGQIFTNGNIGSLSIGGDLIGGAGDNSGQIFANAGFGQVTVKGSILGNVDADRNLSRIGAIVSDNGPIKSLTVGGDIVGGAGVFGGYVFAAGAIGNVKITGDVRGDSSVAAQNNVILSFAASFNGGVQSATSIGNVYIGGSVIGGFGNYSGVVFVGNEHQAGNQATPGVNLPGDPGTKNGTNNGINAPILTAGNMGSVTIKGSLIGGGLVSTFASGFSGAASGWIKADGSMGPVNIAGDLIGSVGQYSGTVQARGAGLAVTKATIASVTVGGSLRGGPGFESGSILASSHDVDPNNVFPNLDAPIATAIGGVKIGGSLFAGRGNLSGTLTADTFIKSVTVNGSVVGDTDGAVDGVIHGGGAIISAGSLGTIAVKGSVNGEFGPNGGGIYALGGNIASVNIARDLTGATATTGIYAAGTIGSVTIGGNIIGETPGSGTVFILADGIQNPATPAKALAIGKLTVKGRVENADILVGSNYYSTGPIVTVENADAGIGAVSVGGDWIASSLAAGTNSSNATFFGVNGAQSVAGSNLNAAIASRIASIAVKGNVFGTPDSAGDGFGFFAQQVGSLKIRGVAQTLPPAAGGVILLGDPVSTDVRLRTFGGS